MPKTSIRDVDPAETQDWLASMDEVVRRMGPARAQFLLGRLIRWGKLNRVVLPFTANTPYVNTIPVEAQPDFPGDRTIERRIKSLTRWNAMATVVRANRASQGIGGHISTYASAATLLEIGFNHFFKGPKADGGGDQIFFQGHAAPGIYARAFLEYRLDVDHLEGFRREISRPQGLASYPHPWLMPTFWQFPTVSMGLTAIDAIYQARFNRFLEHRGIKDTSNNKVWAFLGDGETDEPESLGAITLASRESLDNLIFVINCNLQRLDGPVRGNGQIIQELEAAFRGAGWRVIKVMWGCTWDPLFAADTDGLLETRMGETVDGEWQKYSVENGAYAREKFFGVDTRLAKLVEHMTDDDISRLGRGGHDPVKVYAAFHEAVNHVGSPTVILAKTIKGYGLGEAGEGRNVSHQQKKLNFEELKKFRDRFEVPIADSILEQTPWYRPPKNSPEVQYLLDRRQALGGSIPQREYACHPLITPSKQTFAEFFESSGDREAATTMAYVRMLARLLDDKEIGKFIVPIIPDEARTFGMDALFRKYGIYASRGQLYDPVDSHLFLYYREDKKGQILEEGITEAGSMASFIAAGTAYSTHGVTMIPFFTFYSMFGFQRIGDQIWAACDQRTRGFLIGATSGRTTLAGEGLQHQDGHSHVMSSVYPSVWSYDPAFAYELAVIIHDGIDRMYRQCQDVIFYITVANEPYAMPAMPKGVEEGILKGMYKFRPAPDAKGKRIHLFGSGSILRESLKAQEILAEKYGVSADVWSVTSYSQLRREALDCQRWNMLHPTETPRVPYLRQQLENEPFPIVAAGDYMKIVPEQIARWTPRRLFALGTDGYGRSENRATLRHFFEVDHRFITHAAVYELARAGEVPQDLVVKVMRDMEIDPEKPNPATT
ncbi:MAG: pyruvate dehydrogenase (acetyl-transferring), homodimeric type [Phycisphaerales bacterium]|nr:pyruvate dehydrogenase (acetyl-transferring), homodimeric type [Phycisphaerales bacterium]